jgi:hypothetical protein
MLNNIKTQFKMAREVERTAEKMLADTLTVGSVIVFKKGNMKACDNAEVLCVSGRGVKIINLFSKTERWIDVSDIQSI